MRQRSADRRATGDGRRSAGRWPRPAAGTSRSLDRVRGVVAEADVLDEVDVGRRRVARRRPCWRRPAAGPRCRLACAPSVEGGRPEDQRPGTDRPARCPQPRVSGSRSRQPAMSSRTAPRCAATWPTPRARAPARTGRPARRCDCASGGTKLQPEMANTRSSSSYRSSSSARRRRRTGAGWMSSSRMMPRSSCSKNQRDRPCRRPGRSRGCARGRACGPSQPQSMVVDQVAAGLHLLAPRPAGPAAGRRRRGRPAGVAPAGAGR